MVGQVFVEIGCSDSPVAVQGNHAFEVDDQYIGFDIDSSAVNAAQSKILERAPDIHAEVRNCSGDSLPLPDSSLDEVFLGNVVGSPRIDLEHLNDLRNARITEWLEHGDTDMPEPVTLEDWKTIPSILRESHRVLKAAGQLTILETLTPPI